MCTPRSDVVAPPEARQIVLGVYGSVAPTATSVAEAIYPPEALTLRPETVTRLAYELATGVGDRDV